MRSSLRPPASLRGACWSLMLALIVAGSTIVERGLNAQAAVVVSEPCWARADQTSGIDVTWHLGPPSDRPELDQWCFAVGPPILVSPPPSSNLPAGLEEIVVLTWNVHLAEGQLTSLIQDLRAGRFTDGRPVRHFVLLLQELHRRGSEVPPFVSGARSAYAITARDPQAPHARDYVLTGDLSLLYVPSMRNGAAAYEDRGNAILSTEPLLDTIAMELPFERQRRVAVGASISVRTSLGVSRLNLFNVHFEPLSAPSSLWIFRNPRRRQIGTVLELLQSPRFEHDAQSIGTVLGGDFNTIQGGAEEDAYVKARAWSLSLINEDRRTTHRMGRLDYLFFRLAPGWTATTTRVEEKYGSDHHPVLGWFAMGPSMN